jgi:hypothetical protein
LDNLTQIGLFFLGGDVSSRSWGPQLPLRVNWDIESWVKTVLCLLKGKKTSPGLEFGSVWWPIVVVYGVVALLVVCNVVFYSMVVLLVVRELPATITGSLVGSLIEFGAIFFFGGCF